MPPTPAPTPRQAEAARAALDPATIEGDAPPPRPARVGIRVTWDDEEPLTLWTDEVGPGDDLECRQATGFPLSLFLNADQLTADAAAAVYWFARRKNGSPKFTLAQTFTKLGSLANIVEKMTTEVVTEERDPQTPASGS